jgi:excisionase family DNA binding protein
MPAKNQKKCRTRVILTRTSEVLDVRMAAELLTVSPDTVYDLFKRGELPGRKVGRRWLTTRNAVLRWIENSSENNTLARAIERGDRQVITTALKSGKAQIQKRKTAAALSAPLLFFLKSFVFSELLTILNM